MPLSSVAFGHGYFAAPGGVWRPPMILKTISKTIIAAGQAQSESRTKEQVASRLRAIRKELRNGRRVRYVRASSHSNDEKRRNAPGSVEVGRAALLSTTRPTTNTHTRNRHSHTKTPTVPPPIHPYG